MLHLNALLQEQLSWAFTVLAAHLDTAINGWYPPQAVHSIRVTMTEVYQPRERRQSRLWPDVVIKEKDYAN